MLELKKWAVERGIKQKDLAKILDVSPQLITEWFAFRRAPTGEKVNRNSGVDQNEAKGQENDQL
jgi:predicted transcriptional regulator